MPDKKVLLTGITGFIGSHIAVQLLNRGYELVGSLRDEGRIPKIREVLSRYAPIEKLSFVQANLTDKDVWKDICKQVDYVMHVASPLPKVLPKDEEKVIGPAVEGTMNVLKAAAEGGVKRVVLTSSVTAIMYGKRSEGTFTEEDWSDPQNEKANTSYSKSKTLAERAAWEFVEKEGNGLELVVVNPSVVLGPVLEKDFSTSIEVVKKMLDGSMPALPKIAFSVVDVRSLAELHLLAMEKKEAAGQRFIGSGEVFWMKEIADILRKEYPEKKIPSGILPNFLIRFMANFDKSLKAILIDLNAERKPLNTKAIQMLDWKPIPGREAIIETARTLFDKGVLQKN